MVLAAGSVFGAGTAKADGDHLYGAIAFSEESWVYGTSVDAETRGAAVDEALAWCEFMGGSDCVVLVDWSDGCGALVYSDYAVGSGWGSDRRKALAYAYSSLAELHPPAVLANVGSAELSGAHISEVLCTANAY
ncbi:DUF4189 domain-containing protein [Nocardia sp. NPDC050718]|uniref:DUF4189 domain-containing protein n=1 Tax=Nocardia sp. NPDC050718 TaxID=3155788 RepID=UPI0033FD1723